MSKEILNIILGAVSIIVTGLASWGVAVFTNWLNTKIQDKKIANLLASITTIITEAVMSIFQEFVEALKQEGKFTPEKQKMAKEKCLARIASQLTEEMRQFIETNYGDVEEWLSKKIESTIYSLKNK